MTTWIPAEQPPHRHRHVLMRVVDADGTYHELGRYCDIEGKWEIPAMDYAGEGQKVVAWTPIPEYDGPEEIEDEAQ